ncbi:MAG: hypothetical protein IKW28_01515 [Lachnospiraceae bacterium]|nr:hypothetical protein [Lachnospiraceae bacterium]
MKVKMVKRVLTGALALTLALAPTMGVMATSKGTSKGTVAGPTQSQMIEQTQTQGTGYAQTEEQVVKAYSKVKNSLTVAGIRSSISGVFMLEKGIGLATVTNSTAIASDYALEKGARPYVKVYDMDVKKSELAKACMDATAEAFGARAFGYINFELGKMEDGKYSLLSGGKGIDAVISIPSVNYTEGATYAVICVQEGGVISILKDTTPDNNVIDVTLPAGHCALALVEIG